MTATEHLQPGQIDAFADHELSPERGPRTVQQSHRRVPSMLAPAALDHRA